MCRLFLLTLALSGCATLWSYDGPMAAYGTGHALITADVVALVGATIDREKEAALLACGYWIGHEIEESRGLSHFPSGRLDFLLDWLAPCVAGFAVAWRIGGVK